MSNPIKNLYLEAGKRFGNVGTEEEFKQRLENPQNRKTLYDALGKSGIGADRLGDYELFDKWISSSYENPSNVPIEEPSAPRTPEDLPEDSQQLSQKEPAPQPQVQQAPAPTGQKAIGMIQQGVQQALEQPQQPVEPEMHGYGTSFESDHGLDYEGFWRLSEEYRKLTEENAAMVDIFQRAEAKDKAEAVWASAMGSGVARGAGKRLGLPDPDAEYRSDNAARWNEYKKEEARLRDEIDRHPVQRAAILEATVDAEEQQGILKDQLEKFRTNNADALFTARARSMRGAAGMRALGPSKEHMEVLSQQKSVEDAIALNKKTQQLLKAPRKDDDSNAFANYAKGMAAKGTDLDFWTFGLTEIARNLNIRDVAMKLQKEEEAQGVQAEHLDLDTFLTEPEKALLSAFYDNLQASALRSEDLSVGYQAGMTAMDSAKFMAEFIVTGGVTKAATKGVTRAIERWLIGKASTKAGSMLAKGLAVSLRSAIEAAVRLPLHPSTYQNVAQQLITYDEDGKLQSSFNAIKDGLIDHAIELYSESMGDHLVKVVTLPFSQLLDALPNTTVSQLYKQLQNSPVHKLLKQGQWHGLFGEMLEEWYGNLLRAVAGHPEELKQYATVEQQLITLAAFAPTTVIGGIASTAQYSSAQNNFKNSSLALRAIMADAGYESEQTEYLIDQIMNTTPRQIAEKITPVVNQVAVENEENGLNLYIAFTEFIKAKCEMQAFDGVYEVQHEEMKQDTDAVLQARIGEYTNKNNQVEIVQNKDGEQFFAISDVLDAREPLVVLKDFQGQERMVSKDLYNKEYQSNALMGKDAYLSSIIMLKQQQEQQHQAQIAERERLLNDIRLGEPAYFQIDEQIIQGTPQAITPDGDITVHFEDHVEVLTPEEYHQLFMETVVTAEQEAQGQQEEQEAQEAEEQPKIPKIPEEDPDLKKPDDPPEPSTAAVAVDETPPSKEDSSVEVKGYEVEGYTEAEAAAAEETAAEPEMDLPLTKDGEVDYDILLDQNPEQFAKEITKELGEETAIETMSVMTKQIDATITKVQKQAEKAASATKAIALRKQIAALQTRRKALTSLIAQSSQQTQQEAVQAPPAQVGQIGQNITEKWNDAPKQPGNEETFTLPNGQQIKGRWVLTEAQAVTPSHNPHTLQTSEGFPTTKDGKNINDNDYTKKAAEVETMAQGYDGRAIDHPVFTQDGVVISGNNRVMSGILAAERGTDTKYQEALVEKASKMGFTSEQISQFTNPRLFVEVSERLPLTTETFALFNQRETKSKTPTERAIVVSKRDNSRVIDLISRELDGYERLSDLYQNQGASTAVAKYLIKGGLVNQNELPELFENGSFTSAGKDFLESVLVGSVMKEDQVKVLATDGMKNVRQRIVKAIVPLIENSKIREDGRIIEDINQGILYLYKARQAGLSLREYFLQADMFNPATYDINGARNAIELQGTEKDFRDYVLLANKKLKDPIANMFTGEIEGKKTLYSDLEKQYDNEQRATIDAARAANVQAGEQSANDQGAVLPGAPKDDEQGGPGIPAAPGEQTETSPAGGESEQDVTSIFDAAQKAQEEAKAKQEKEFDREKYEEEQKKRDRPFKDVSTEELERRADEYSKKIKENEQYAIDNNLQRTKSTIGVGTLPEREFQEFTELTGELARRAAISAEEAKERVAKKRAERLKTREAELKDQDDGKGNQNSLIFTEEKQSYEKDTDKTSQAVSEPKAIQLQLGWEETNGNVPAVRMQEAQDIDSGADALQRKGAYDYAIDNRITNMERVLTNHGHLNFLGSPLTGPAKITGANDVAFLFKNLENASSENVFLVAVNEEGEYRVLYMATGSSTATVVDTQQITPFVKDFGATNLYMVHNHPSGAIVASSGDHEMLQVLKDLGDILGVKVEPGIIINLDSGKYAVFGHEAHRSSTKEYARPASVKGERPVEIYQFNKQALYAPMHSADKLDSAEKVAQFLSQQKRGIQGKLHAIITNHDYKVTRYFLMDPNITTKELANTLLYEAGKHGNVVFLAANQAVAEPMQLQKLLKLGDVHLVDMLVVKQDQQILNNYISLSNRDVISEAKTAYQASEVRESQERQIQGLENYTYDDIKELAQRHIQDVLFDIGEDANIVDMAILGSRERGEARQDSDLDIVVEYEGKAREDNLFNALNETPLEIEGIKVDINPIKAEKSGTLQEFLKKNDRYLEEGAQSRYDANQESIKEQAIKDGTFMKAPNGQPTNLTERQWLQVRTQEFKNWFGNWESDQERSSQVVDENGEPMVVYHGTPSTEGFVAFDKSKIGSSNDHGVWGHGFYFSPMKRQADQYREGHGDLYPVFLSIKNPLKIADYTTPKQMADHLDIMESNFSAGPEGVRIAYNQVQQFTSNVKEKGHDGVISEKSNEIVAFEPNQIKSAENNRGSFDEKSEDIRYRKVDQAGFYSTVENALENLPQKKGTPEQMKAMLLKNGAKKAELDWMGWDDHFPDAGKVITRADIQQWVDGNRIQVQKVLKTETIGKGEFTQEAEEKYNELRDIARKWENLAAEVANTGEISDWEREQADKWIDEYGSFDNIYEQLLPEIEENPDNYVVGDAAKYFEYQSPGGKNYKELLLIWTGNKEHPFMSRHFDEGNIIAHVRLNERSINGERVLFIEELQSDWAQNWRKEADARENVDKLKEQIGEHNQRLNEINKELDTIIQQARDMGLPTGASSTEWKMFGQGLYDTVEISRLENRQDEVRNKKEYNELKSEIDQIRERQKLIANKRNELIEERSAIEKDLRDNLNLDLSSAKTWIHTPDMPFKKTDQWVNLSLRKLVRYAAENGFDRIAWTNGEQQVERYDLSKHFNKIVWIPGNENTDGRGRLESFDKDGRPVVNQTINPSDLADYVGKEMAESLLNSTPDENGMVVREDLDLEVGGEGMKAFYDNIIPKAANKIGKTFEAKVEEINLPLDQRDPIQSLPITPAMKASVQEGVPLFRASEGSVFANRVIAKNQIEELADKLNLKVAIVDKADLTSEKQKAAKGFYDTATNQITIVADNHQTVDDALKTLIHEGVAHKGLRELFGKDFDNFLDNVYQNADKDMREAINKLISKNDWSIRMATEEYLATLAESTNFNKNATLWTKIKDFFMDMLRKVGIHLKAPLTDADMRYVLQKSYDRLVGLEGPGGVFDAARDAQLRSLVGLNEKVDPKVKAEKDKIVKEAKKDGSYLKAPNGEKSNLAPEQWVTARTQGFKKWFGDWTKPFNLEKELANAPKEHKPAVLNVENADFMTILNRTNQEAFDVNGEPLAKFHDEYYRQLEDPIQRAEAKSAREAYDQRLEETSYKIREAYQDSMLSLKVLMQKVSEMSGKPIQLFENAYIAENHVSSKNLYEKEHYQENYFRHIPRAIHELGKKINGTYQDVVTYAMAKHGLERNTVMALRDAQRAVDKIRAEMMAEAKDQLRRNELSEEEYHDTVRFINEEMEERLDMFFDQNRERDYAGLTALFPYENPLDGSPYLPGSEKMAKDLTDKVEKMAPDQARELWNRVNAATKKSLLKLYETGIMTRSVYEKVRDMYNFYIPLRGFAEQTAEDMYKYLMYDTSPFSSPMQEAKGRKSIAEDPFATIGTMAESAIQQGNRNWMKQKFLNMAMNHESDLLSVREMWYVNEGTKESPDWVQSIPILKSGMTAMEMNQAFEKFDERMEDLSQQGMAAKRLQGLNIPYRTLGRQANEHAVIVKSAGKDYVVYVNGNPRAAQAVNGLTNPDSSKERQTIMRFNRWLSANYTTRSPKFMIRNLFRDTTYSLFSIYAKEGKDYNRTFRRNLANNYVDIWKLMGDYRKSKLDTSTEKGRLIMEFLENGGETGYTALKRVDEYKRIIGDLMKEAQGNKLVSLKKIGMIPFEQIGFANRCIEDICRFTAFMTSRQMGREIEQSIADAKEVTVNFNRKGAYQGYGAGLLRTAYLFFNAGVQGMDNFSKLYKANPLKASAGTVAVVTAGALVPYFNMIISSVLGGDPDEYLNMPEWIRRNHLVIGGNGFYVTIPLAIEIRALYGIGDIAYMASAGRMKDQNIFGEIIGQFADVLPMDPVDAYSNIIHNWVPDAVAPIFDNIMNEDFTKKPIYHESDWNRYYPSYTKAYAGTNKTLVKASELLNRIGGGDEYTKGWIESNITKVDLINPAKWEHLLEGYFGGMLTAANETAKTVSMIWDPDQRMLRNVPLVNVLFQHNDKTSSYNFVNNMYHHYREEHDKTRQSYMKYKLEPEKFGEKLDKLMDTDRFRRYEIYESYKKDLRRLEIALKDAVDDIEIKDLRQQLNELKGDLVDDLLAND